MKTVIFCGGEGTRIRDVSENAPKPLIKLNGFPLIFYVMCQYAKYGYTDFILCGGYKFNKIEEFTSLLTRNSLALGIHNSFFEINNIPHPSSWKINAIDTGSSIIGERLWKVRKYLLDEELFFASYSDSITDLDINISKNILVKNQAICCFAAVKPSQSYHWVDFQPNNFELVSGLNESSQQDHWINGGYMCLKPEIFLHMKEGEELVLEPFARLASANKLAAYKHLGYWKSIDTYKDLIEAERDLSTNKFPPFKTI